MKVEKCLIVEWTSLPKEWKDWFREKHDWRFHNDVMIEYICEWEPEEGEGWDKESIRKWYDECKKEGETFEKFMKDTGMDFVLYLIKEAKTSDFDKIIVDICW